MIAAAMITAAAVAVAAFWGNAFARFRRLDRADAWRQHGVAPLNPYLIAIHIAEASDPSWRAYRERRAGIAS